MISLLLGQGNCDDADRDDSEEKHFEGQQRRKGFVRGAETFLLRTVMGKTSRVDGRRRRVLKKRRTKVVMCRGSVQSRNLVGSL